MSGQFSLKNSSAPGIEELDILDYRLMDNDFYAFSPNASHDALNGGGTKVVRADLHNQPRDTNDLRIAADNLVDNEVLASGVGLDDAMTPALRHRTICLPAVVSCSWANNGHRNPFRQWRYSLRAHPHRTHFGF